MTNFERAPERGINPDFEARRDAIIQEADIVDRAVSATQYFVPNLDTIPRAAISPVNRQLWSQHFGQTPQQFVDHAAIPRDYGDRGGRGDYTTIAPGRMSSGKLVTNADYAILAYRKTVDPKDSRGNANIGHGAGLLARYAGRPSDRAKLREELDQRWADLAKGPTVSNVESYLHKLDLVRAEAIALEALSVLGIEPPRDLTEEEKAIMLKWRVLPRLAGDQVISDLEKEASEEEAEQGEEKINLQRINRLFELRAEHGGEVFESRPEFTMLGEKKYSYYVWVSERDEDGMRLAVADNPIVGNATYIVDEKNAAGTWHELLAMSKKDAVEYGAIRVVHNPEDEGHDQMISTYLEDAGLLRQTATV